MTLLLIFVTLFSFLCTSHTLAGPSVDYISQETQDSPAVQAQNGRKKIEIERLIVQGSTQAFLKNHDKALAAFQQALNLAPNSPVILQAIAEQHEALENLPSAEFYATQAKEQAGDEPRYYLYLSNYYTRQYDIPSAEKVLVELLDRFPDHTEALETLAYLQYSSGQYDKALDTYKVLGSRLGPNEKISYRIFQIQYERNDTDGMEEALLDLQQLQPKNSDVKRNLAELYIQTQRSDEAITILEQALAIDSLDVATLVPLAQLYSETGQETKSQELWSRAQSVTGSPEDAFSRASHLFQRSADDPSTVSVVIQLLEYAIEANPDYTEAIVLLGTIRFEEEEFNLAGDLLYRALELNPRHQDIWLQAATAYLHAQIPKRAAEIADEALMLFPGQIPLLRVSAYAHMDAYNNRQAVKQFIQFLERLHQDTEKPLEESDIYAALGLLYSRLEEFDASDEAYQNALALNPENPFLLNNLAYSYADRSLNLQDALDYARKAVASEPQNIHFMDTLGWVLYKLNDLDEAEKWTQKAINTGPASAVMYDHLGDILLKMSKLNEARAAWDKGLEIDPDNNSLLKKRNNSP